MNREIYTKNCIGRLSHLAYEVSLLNTVNYFDINIVSEFFFRDLLNKIFDLNLENLNTKDQNNYPGIDLGDNTNSLAFQVTSEKTSSKVKDTLKQFKGRSYVENFSKLKILLLINKKPDYSFSYDREGHSYFILEEDIIDLGILCKELRQLNIDKLKDISTFLDEELSDAPNKDKTSSEVHTIIDLIEYLSSNRSDGNSPMGDDPDPENKISIRFSKYTPYLNSEISRYIPYYSEVRMQAEKVLGLDLAKIRFIRSYLQTKSIQHLLRADGNPIIALNEMTEEIKAEISTSGKCYDYQAIRYYLIYELIQCNVFPNP